LYISSFSFLEISHFDGTSFLAVVFGILSLEALSGSFESDVSIQELLVGVVPFHAVLFLEVLLVLVHQTQEIGRESWPEAQLAGDEVRNGTKVHEDRDDI